MEERYLEEHKRRQEVKVMVQRQEREWPVFQRPHGVAVPETPQPSKGDLFADQHSSQRADCWIPLVE